MPKYFSSILLAALIVGICFSIPVAVSASVVGVPQGFTFAKNLSYGTVDQDVVYLKLVLTSESCLYGVSGTEYFGTQTLAAVKCFQNKYRAQISAFAGYAIAATGFVGNATRTQLNILLGSQTPTTNQCTDGNWTSTLNPATCPSSSQQTRFWNKIGTCSGGVIHPSSETVSCNYNVPTCTAWIYTAWSPSTCPASGIQTRTVSTATPSGCTGGSPVISQTCLPAATCATSNWSSALSPQTCPVSGQQTKTWAKIGICSGGVTHPSSETVSCNYNVPTCTAWIYTAWSPSTCPASGIQTRTVSTATPSGCTGGSPVISQTCTYPAGPSIIITSPNGGESWVQDQAHNITWASSGLPSSTYVDLCLLNIASNFSFSQGSCFARVAASTGSYSWTPPVSGSGPYGIGSKKIGITTVSGTGDVTASDISNNQFMLIGPPQSITLTYPVGGESLARGYINLITWTYSGPIPYVDIRLYKNGFPELTIASSVPNTGSYTWTPPITLVSGPAYGSDYKIQVSTPYNTAFDVIGDMSGYLMVDGTAPSITITSPNGGENLRRGQTASITFVTTGLMKSDKITIKANDYADITRGVIRTVVVENLMGDIDTYSWSVPTNLAIGTDYQLTVDVYRNNSLLVSDTSDNYFNVISATSVGQSQQQSAGILPGIWNWMKRLVGK